MPPTTLNSEEPVFFIYDMCSGEQTISKSPQSSVRAHLMNSLTGNYNP